MEVLVFVNYMNLNYFCNVIMKKIVNNLYNITRL